VRKRSKKQSTKPELLASKLSGVHVLIGQNQVQNLNYHMHDAIGAMFLSVGHKNEWPYDWESLLKEFSVNGYWVYRFSVGFDIGN
jgi:hypothetical protein